MDIFQYKRHDYLVIIDYYSRWIEIKQLTSLTSDCVISRLKAVFTTHAVTWYSRCGGIRQRKTVRLGRIQEIRKIMVLRSTYHKPVFS